MGNQSVKDPTSATGPECVQANDTNIQKQLQTCFQHQIHSTESSHLELQHFKKMFGRCENFAELLYHGCVQYVSSSGRDENDQGGITQEHFISYGSYILQMVNLQDQMDFSFAIFSSGKASLTLAEFDVLLKACFTIDLISTNITVTEFTDIPLTKSIAKSLFSTETSVERSDFMYWCGRHFTNLLHGVHPYICAVLSGKTTKTDDHPDDEGAVSSMFDSSCVLSVPLLWSLHSYIPSTYTRISGSNADEANITQKHSLGDVTGAEGWSLLYNSNSQGLSINRFEHHVMSYAGPTLTFIKFEGHLYCVGTDVEWCTKTTRWGGSDCFLLQVLPQYRVIQAGAEMLYLNIQDRKSPKGLYIGKDSRTTLLQVDEDFATVKHYGIDVPLQSIEVWGCGSRAVLEAQRKQRQWEHQEAERHKNRKLKLEDWENNPDRQLLELGGVQTEHAER